MSLFAVASNWTHCCHAADIFICANCDDEHGGFSVGNHEESHTLVRCIETTPGPKEVDDEDSMDGRLKAVEHRLTTVGGKLSAFEGHLTGINERLSGIEKLLEALVSGRDSSKYES